MDNTPFGANDKPAKVAGLKRHKKMISIIAVGVIVLVFFGGVAAYGVYNGWYVRESSPNKPSSSQEKLGSSSSDQSSSSNPNGNGTKNSTDKKTDPKSQNNTSENTKNSSSAASKPSTTPANPAHKPKPKPTPTPPATRKPLLIKHGWDIPTTSWAAGKVASMDKMPFDGVVMSLPNSLSTEVQVQSSTSYTTYKNALSSISGANFKNLKYNFLAIYSTPAGDIFDNWSKPIANYSNVARAAKEAGFTGIYFDNEDYFGYSLDYPDNCGRGKTVAQCRTQAYTRGQEVMNAIRSQWPNVQVILAHGPTDSEPATYNYLRSKGIAYNDIAWANEIRGSFSIGMAAATIGNNAQVIDGGQLYAARTTQNFKDIAYWQKTGMATQGSIIPSAIRSQWPNTISSAFGIYDKPPLEDTSIPMNTLVWKTTLTNALKTTDRYVWAYTEGHDWWGSGWPSTPVPSGWVTATRDAYNAVK